MWSIWFSTSNSVERWKKWNERKNNQTKNECSLLKSKSSNHGKFYCRRNIFAVTAAVTISAIVVDVFLYFVFVDVRTAFTFMEKSIGWTDCSWIAGILQWFGSSNTRNHFNTVVCTIVTHSCTMWHRICVPMFESFSNFSLNRRLFAMFWIFPF